VTVVSLVITVLFSIQAIRKQNHEMSIQFEQARAQWSIELAKSQKDTEHEKRLANEQLLAAKRTDLETERIRVERTRVELESANARIAADRAIADGKASIDLHIAEQNQRSAAAQSAVLIEQAKLQLEIEKEKLSLQLKSSELQLQNDEARRAREKVTRDEERLTSLLDGLSRYPTSEDHSANILTLWTLSKESSLEFRKVIISALAHRAVTTRVAPEVGVITRLLEGDASRDAVSGLATINRISWSRCIEALVFGALDYEAQRGRDRSSLLLTMTSSPVDQFISELPSVNDFDTLFSQAYREAVPVFIRDGINRIHNSPATETAAFRKLALFREALNKRAELVEDQQPGPAVKKQSWLRRATVTDRQQAVQANPQIRLSSTLQAKLDEEYDLLDLAPLALGASYEGLRNVLRKSQPVKETGDAFIDFAGCFLAYLNLDAEVISSFTPRFDDSTTTRVDFTQAYVQGMSLPDPYKSSLDRSNLKGAIELSEDRHTMVLVIGQ
jgi:hypothetical protein